MDILRILNQPSEYRPAGALRVIGIDLGTTNSTVCEIVWEAEKASPNPPRCLNIGRK
jgi:hypothetical protein